MLSEEVHVGSGAGAGVGAGVFLDPFLASVKGATVEVVSGVGNSKTIESCPHVRHMFGQFVRTTSNSGLKHSEYANVVPHKS